MKKQKRNMIVTIYNKKVFLIHNRMTVKKFLQKYENKEPSGNNKYYEKIRKYIFNESIHDINSIIEILVKSLFLPIKKNLNLKRNISIFLIRVILTLNSNFRRLISALLSDLIILLENLLKCTKIYKFKSNRTCYLLTLINWFQIMHLKREYRNKSYLLLNIPVFILSNSRIILTKLVHHLFQNYENNLLEIFKQRLAYTCIKQLLESNELIILHTIDLLSSILSSKTRIRSLNALINHTLALLSCRHYCFEKDVSVLSHFIKNIIQELDVETLSLGRNSFLRILGLILCKQASSNLRSSFCELFQTLSIRCSGGGNLIFFHLQKLNCWLKRRLNMETKINFDENFLFYDLCLNLYRLINPEVLVQHFSHWFFVCSRMKEYKKLKYVFGKLLKIPFKQKQISLLNNPLFSLKKQFCSWNSILQTKYLELISKFKWKDVRSWLLVFENSLRCGIGLNYIEEFLMKNIDDATNRLIIIKIVEKFKRMTTSSTIFRKKREKHLFRIVFCWSELYYMFTKTYDNKKRKRKKHKLNKYTFGDLFYPLLKLYRNL